MDKVHDIQVFISHAQSEVELAKDLSRYLKAQGFRVFNPSAELFPGDNWHLEAGKALEASQAMVVLISPEAVRSPWVQGDIQYALGARQFAGRLISVEVEPTQDVPWILRRLQWIRIKDDPAQVGHQVAEILKAA
jgi:TIR domain-containing protein